MITLVRKTRIATSLRAGCIVCVSLATLWPMAALAAGKQATWIQAAAPITYKMDKPFLPGFKPAHSVPAQEAPAAVRPVPAPQAKTALPAPQMAVPKTANPMHPRYDVSNIDRSHYSHMKIGRPYKVAGKSYTPKHNPDYDKKGMASWYGDKFHGKPTANGEMFDKMAMTAAHKTLPLNSHVIVTNLKTGKQIKVRLNDRGPFIDDRIIDLSEAAAKALGITHHGVSDVRVQYAGPADPSEVGPKMVLGPKPSLKRPSLKSPLLTPVPTPKSKVAETESPAYRPLRLQQSAPTPPAAAKPQAQAESVIKPVTIPKAPAPADLVPATPKRPDTLDLTVDSINPDAPTAEIVLPEVDGFEALNAIPNIPTIGSLGETESDTITLTIKGPIHMAKHSGTPSDKKGRLIPANYKEK